MNKAVDLYFDLLINADRIFIMMNIFKHISHELDLNVKDIKLKSLDNS